MSTSSPAERLRVALEMADVGLEMMKRRLEREHPDWDEVQVEEAFVQWLRERPGAPFGDYPGPASTRVLGTKGP